MMVNQHDNQMVITKKDGKAKARLVVRGFGEDFIMPRDSPTVGKGGFSHCSKYEWVIKNYRY